MNVSVIIPCFNHAHFLPMALRSVQEQDEPADEIIVVDDGSTDHTARIVDDFPGVRYLFQQNKGLPAARNLGFSSSKGKYIAFLDADDFFYPNAISSNLSCLLRNPTIAFVSGCHNLVNEEGILIDDSTSVTPDHPYRELLKRNYIGMNGAVMYRRSALESFPFDETLKACEDYDQYLRITREYEVLHHQEKIAAYRKYKQSMSGNPLLMLTEVTKVLHRQKAFLGSKEDQRSWREGMRNWQGRYLPEIYKKLKAARHLDPMEREVLKKFWYPLLKIRVREWLH